METNMNRAATKQPILLNKRLCRLLVGIVSVRPKKTQIQAHNKSTKAIILISSNLMLNKNKKSSKLLRKGAIEYLSFSRQTLNVEFVDLVHNLLF
jgi:hypothetical protein